MPKTNLRTEYLRTALDEGEAGEDPVELFRRWYEDAREAGEPEPNAMTLATSDSAGRPSARIVLCKEFDAEGFVFFTNYASRKGRELAASPQACLLFFWPRLERQVRISGAVAQVSSEVSDRYFAERPRDARIGAWASPQSEPIAGREELEARFAQALQRFEGRDAVERPAHWGGYRLAPAAIEFWQGRASRLHDRLLFTRRSAPAPSPAAHAWTRTRLAP